MGRWKAAIGPKLKARDFENQRTEAKIGVRVLNNMTGLGSPSFERTARNLSREARIPIGWRYIQQRRS